MFVEELKKEDFIDFIKKYAFKGNNKKQIVYDFNNLWVEKKSSKVTISIPNKVYLHSNRFLNNCNRTPNGEKIVMDDLSIFEFTDFYFSI
ncbi:MAG: hypothetical protein J5779_00355, partial [Clostridia bacterium]|nr:hypothetical protein [Clostridia bacterium]